jgi:hypothetical protein
MVLTVVMRNAVPSLNYSTGRILYKSASR